MDKMENAVQLMIKIANDNTHGYSQTYRWGDDYDCSSLVISCLELCGIPAKSCGATYTGNLKRVLETLNFKCIYPVLSSSINLKRGDILLRPFHHVAVYIGNNKIVEAISNELGKAVGGQTGDQTGREITINNYHNSNWSYVLRYQPTNYPSETRFLYIFKVCEKIILGKYGNNPKRKKLIESENLDYYQIQTCTNKIIALVNKYHIPISNIKNFCLDELNNKPSTVKLTPTETTQIIDLLETIKEP